MIGWGTPAEVALYVARPVRTIRNWARDGLIPSACDPATRTLMVHAGEARKVADRRATRRRNLAA